MKYTPRLSLTSTTQKPKYIFLDVTIAKTFAGKLLATLYKWEIDRKSYLHRTSEHPKTLKQSIPYSQALRLKRICTTEEDFAEQSKALTKRLVERSYNDIEIQQKISNSFTIERAHVLNQKKTGNIFV